MGPGRASGCWAWPSLGAPGSGRVSDTGQAFGRGVGKLQAGRFTLGRDGVDLASELPSGVVVGRCQEEAAHLAKEGFGLRLSQACARLDRAERLSQARARLDRAERLSQVRSQALCPRVRGWRARPVLGQVLTPALESKRLEKPILGTISWAFSDLSLCPWPCTRRAF